jgi:hypothetical protein
MGNRATSWRDIPSGTWLVLILTTSFLIVGLGNLISQWSRVTSDLSFGLAALVGVVLPLAALAWGVHLARRAGTQ